MKNNSEASEETKQQVLDELESLRNKQIEYIQESFSLIYNFSQMVNQNLNEIEGKPNEEVADARSQEIQEKLKKYEALIA
jgi:anaerobic ribonucleoside-triphosphate reductase